MSSSSSAIALVKQPPYNEYDRSRFYPPDVGKDIRESRWLQPAVLKLIPHASHYSSPSLFELHVSVARSPSAVDMPRLRIRGVLAQVSRSAVGRVEARTRQMLPD